MDYRDSLIQGLIQGLTEFLPVSSSGHLALFQQITGATAPLAFDLILHVATLVATVWYFRKDILILAREFFLGLTPSGDRTSQGWHLGWAVMVGSICTALLGLALKPLVESALESRQAVAAGLLATAALLWWASTLPRSDKSLGLTAGLLVGLVQGLAVFPGLSRSGATIVAGLLWGLSARQAFRFSFLMSLPAVAGAALLELGDLSLTLPQGWPWGFVVALLSGLVALKVFHRMVTLGHWRLFSAYCAALALMALAL